MEAYIVDVAAFLPNQPIDNDHIENVLGRIDGVSSRTRRIILRNNGIKQRYYAIDPETGKFTHNNSQLAAEAIRRLGNTDDVDMICCGTSSPDTVMPGIGPLVHGELGWKPIHVMSTAGQCLAGITAFNYAAMSVATGNAQKAVATGSEMCSTFLRADFLKRFRGEDVDLEKQPEMAFGIDFLRWMLSDGAGAVMLQGKPATDGLSLRIDWCDLFSYAGEIETCMYAGAIKTEDGRIEGWRTASSLMDAVQNDYFPIKQDVKLLNKWIPEIGVNRALKTSVERHSLHADEFDWFLPHYSSEYFRKILFERMHEIGFPIPYEKWFTNLTYKGNTGAASIFIILEELFHSGKLEKGQKILCFVPESGRFSMSYMQLTVV